MSSTYDGAFFADRSGSRRSAEAVVPFLADLLEPSSVVDVGCGTGEWAAAFAARGIDDVLGVDGEYVDRSRLAIPAERFRGHDLAEPLDLGRRFDLALCLEVGEHLPADAAPVLVASLARAAPLVLFGAAIPDQRGEGHVNEQWQAWWAARFGGYGYLAVDVLRRAFWDDDRVEWWYVQNTLLYASRGEVERRPRLRALHEATASELLSVVHPRGYLSFRAPPRRHRLRAWRRYALRP
jgi:SAM-dependent methyltransferase